MEFKAIAKNVRISPRKMRLLANVFKKTSVTETLGRLPYIDLAGGLPLSKLIASASANAFHTQKLTAEQLKIKNIIVGAGTTFKRFRPVSRGSAHTYKRRSSNVTVVLEG
ncbi:MAG: 50S ribosomal protein L22 [bacterium]|nr:50S ribosomal protein L22 [bacterium]